VAWVWRSQCGEQFPKSLQSARQRGIAADFVNGEEDELADPLAPGAIPTLGNHTQAEPDNMVDTCALAGDGRFDCGVESVIRIMPTYG
jgi:hypothetical protein